MAFIDKVSKTLYDRLIKEWKKGQNAITQKLKQNAAFNVKKHENPFDKIRLQAGDIDAADWFRFQAFSTAVIEDENLRKRIRAALHGALKRGESKSQFYANLQRSFEQFKAGNVRKLNTVFETQQALAFGAAQQAKLIEVADDFPYWQYHAMHDAHTRPDHMALDGKIFSVSDMRFYPPISFNCRCTATALTARQAGRINPDLFIAETQTVTLPKGTDAFIGNKQKNFVQWLKKRSEKAEPETKALIQKGIEKVLKGLQKMKEQQLEEIRQLRKKARPEIKQHLKNRDFITPDEIPFEVTNGDIDTVISHGHSDLLGMLDVLKNLPETLAKSKFELEAPNGEPDNPKKIDVSQYRYYNYQDKYFFTFRKMKDGKLKLYTISDEISKKARKPAP